VVASVDVVGLSVSDTARVLDMTPVAVRVARHRALRRLRKDASTGLMSVTVS
jgi:RNA polymerase sigma-70 factor (ECF subfamily)